MLGGVVVQSSLDGEEVYWSSEAKRRATTLDCMEDSGDDASYGAPFPSSTIRCLAAMCSEEDNLAALAACSLEEIMSVINCGNFLAATVAMQTAARTLAGRLACMGISELRTALGVVEIDLTMEEQAAALAEPLFRSGCL